MVTIRGHSKYDRAFKIVKRYKEKVQVVIEIEGTLKPMHQFWVDCVDAETNEELPRQKVEIFDFWPSQGDTCLVIMGPYLDWLALELYPWVVDVGKIKMQELHFKAMEKTERRTEDLLQKHVVNLIEGVGTSAVAVVTNESGRQFKMPARCLAVLHKCDRRTSSQSEQVKQMSLLEESAA